VTVRTLDTWRARAACRGPETALFFPPNVAERKDEREARESRAKAICAGCAVRRECLDYALGVGEMHGIWGGLNEAERRGLTESTYS
jgi:WhiB family transcriptional regulator, redox-sensing transcriptional regulator